MAIFSISAPSFAIAKTNDWIVRGRAIYVTPDVSSKVGTIGGSIAAGNDLTPEVDFTRFLSRNIAAELILATSQHSMSVRGSTLGANNGLGTVKLLPPTLLMQYHFNPEGKIRPYAGAGLNYTIFYGAKTGGVANSIKYQDNFGYAFQAGFDYMINDRFGVNFDVKRLYLKTNVLVNGTIKAKVDLDPWIFGVGLAYYF